MSRPLNDDFIELDGERWTLILRGEYTPPAPGSLRFERAPWHGPNTFEPARRRIFRVDEDGSLTLARITDWGWRLHERGGRILAAESRDDGASNVVIEVNLPQASVSGEWIAGRDLKPGVQMHSWVPSVLDFERVCSLRFEGGKLVDMGPWRPDHPVPLELGKPRRRWLQWLVLALLGVAVIVPVPFLYSAWRTGQREDAGRAAASRAAQAMAEREPRVRDCGGASAETTLSELTVFAELDPATGRTKRMASDQWSEVDDATRGCILEALRDVHIEPWDGVGVMVEHRFELTAAGRDDQVSP